MGWAGYVKSHSFLSKPFSGYVSIPYLLTSYSVFIIISYILINQCSTAPSADTGDENGIFSGIISGSADYIAIISLESSSSVN